MFEAIQKNDIETVRGIIATKGREVWILIILSVVNLSDSTFSLGFEHRRPQK